MSESNLWMHQAAPGPGGHLIDGLAAADVVESPSSDSHRLPPGRPASGLELHYLEHGVLRLHNGQANQHFQAGRLLIVAPGHYRGFDCVPRRGYRLITLAFSFFAPGDGRPCPWPTWLMFSAAEREVFRELIGKVSVSVVRIGLLGPIFRKIGQLIEEKPAAVQSASFVAGVSLILATLSQGLEDHVCAASEPASGTQAVETFWEQLRENPGKLGQEWTPRAMARQCGVGRSWFNHITRALFNVSPNVYLTACRLERAAQLLARDPARKIIQVAADVGMPSPQSFTRQFQKRFGMTPKNYRAQYRAPQGNPASPEAMTPHEPRTDE